MHHDHKMTHFIEILRLIPDKFYPLDDSRLDKLFEQPGPLAFGFRVVKSLSQTSFPWFLAPTRLRRGPHKKNDVRVLVLSRLHASDACRSGS